MKTDTLISGKFQGSAHSFSLRFHVVASTDIENLPDSELLLCYT